MKKSIFFAILLMLIPTPAIAEEFFGYHGAIGVGSAVGAEPVLGIRARALKHVPFGFEFNVIIPYGMEMAMPLYLVKMEHFKFHAILPFMGVEIPFMEERISVDWLKVSRDFNMVVGAGAELQFTGKEIFGAKMPFSYVSFTADYRAFVPDPLWVIDNFIDYGVSVFKQSLKEGQVWAGVTLWY